MIECVHSAGQEIAEDRDDVSCAFFVDEGGAANETGDIARCSYSGDQGEILVQQCLLNEHPLKEITKLRVERGVPEYQKLGVTGLKSSDNCAIEYGKECVKLGTTNGLLEFWA